MQTGQNGADGTDGKDGANVRVGLFHGHDALLDQAFAETGKFPAAAVITSAKVDAAGLVTVELAVADSDGMPVVGLSGISASIAKLVPPAAGESFNRWVPYIWRSQVVSGSANGDWPNPDGTAADQGYRENNGTVTDHDDGTYTYAFATLLDGVKTPVSGTAIPMKKACDTASPS